MFWSANYMGVRELKFLLKEENVTLTQVLEADDILQECKADNTALIQFLTRSEILAELVTLITEEPPKDMEITSQYRHSNIACEVLTSQLSKLSHRLCMDPVQMNRLCDFVNRDPPLNPLLASYFSRTVEMFLKRSPKQDCYLHHIVCLRALDFFKARRDFLPNLLRHISTSAIADTFNYFISLSDPFNKIIMDWFDEHQFLENLIQIVCCNYEPEEIHAAPVAVTMTEPPSDVEKGLNEESEKSETNHKENDSSRESNSSIQENHDRRIRAIASANASALLCDLVNPDVWSMGTEETLSRRLRGEAAVRALLQGAFTSAPHHRALALVHACRLLLALTAPSPPPATGDGSITLEERRQVELAIAPHLPLLHHALLQEPDPLPGQEPHDPQPEGKRPEDKLADGQGQRPRRVGAARIHVAALLARLVSSDVEEVHTAILSLGTVGVLVDLVFAFPSNNFLHAQLCALLLNVEANEMVGDKYYDQLIEEFHLLTRLMDTFEDNEDKKVTPRAGLMGHVVAMCRALAVSWITAVLGEPLDARWQAFVANRLRPALARHDTPLGGEYPDDNVFVYEAGAGAGAGAGAYETSTVEGEPAHGCESETSKENFFQLMSERLDNDMWEDTPREEAGGAGPGERDGGATPPAEQASLWDSGSASGAEAGPGAVGEGDAEGEGEGGGGWAQFTDVWPVDPFAPVWKQQEESEVSELNEKMMNLDTKFGDVVELTNNLLSAMSCMAPHDIASIVNDPLAGRALAAISLPLDSLSDAPDASGLTEFEDAFAPVRVQSQANFLAPGGAERDAGADEHEGESGAKDPHATTEPSRDPAPGETCPSAGGEGGHDSGRNETSNERTDANECNSPDAGAAGLDTSER